ncbi:MAG: helix-turn-helix transcriptional regulator [Deltaproteobacteria bacterium]
MDEKQYLEEGIRGFDKTFKAERLWDLDALVRALRVKRSWVYSQTHQNRIPYRRIAGRLRFDPVEIDAWIASQPGWSLKNSADFAGRRKG